jgi:hypothetical protein
MALEAGSTYAGSKRDTNGAGSNSNLGAESECDKETCWVSECCRSVVQSSSNSEDLTAAEVVVSGMFELGPHGDSVDV